MLSCLAEGFPFVCGITVFDSFESEETIKTGVVSMPGFDEVVKGGHCICIVGFNQNTRTFIFRQSWGVSYGMKGYGTIPFDYLTLLGSDFFTMKT